MLNQFVDIFRNLTNHTFMIPWLIKPANSITFFTTALEIGLLLAKIVWDISAKAHDQFALTIVGWIGVGRRRRFLNPDMNTVSIILGVLIILSICNSFPIVRPACAATRAALYRLGLVGS